MTEPQFESLENFRITKAPPSVLYVPNFITDNEASYFWDQVHAAPKVKWTALKDRRLQNWGGTQTAKGMIAEPLPRWLQLLAERMHTTGVFGSLVPNHVLVNEYLPGQGIMPHEDGPFFSPVITTINLGSHCVIKFYRPRDSDIVSETANGREGSDSDNPATTNSRHSLESRRVTSLFLEPNSLLVLREDMYTRFLHGIEPVPQDSLAEVRATCANAAQCPSLAAASDDVLARSTRVSLTIRHAPNTIKLKFKLGGK